MRAGAGLVDAVIVTHCLRGADEPAQKCAGLRLTFVSERRADPRWCRRPAAGRSSGQGWSLVPVHVRSFRFIELIRAHVACPSRHLGARDELRYDLPAACSATGRRRRRGTPKRSPDRTNTFWAMPIVASVSGIEQIFSDHRFGTSTPTKAPRRRMIAAKGGRAASTRVL